MGRIDTVKTEVFKFDELSEDAKQNALESLANVNIDYEWWDYDYEDAARIGLEITKFDLYSRNIDGDFTEYTEQVAANIIKDHGKQCETHKTAKSFIKAIKSLKESESSEEYENAEYEFKCSLLGDYMIILQKSYEYLQSEEAIKETIDCNEYEFTIEGKLY